MTQALLFGSATGTRTSYKGRGINTNPPPSSRGSVEAMITRLLTRQLLSCPGVEKDARREAVTKFLLNVRKSEVCIDELLSTCTTQGGPDGLDTAIDILSGTGELVLKYFWNYLQRDVANWNPDCDRAYKPNDDYWYVLLRAVARTKAEEMEKLQYIMCCANAESRGIREGVVEALRDLRTSLAKDLLRQFAKNDVDHYIRQVAQEALDDLET
jgi:hypothetical protein